MAIGAKQLTSIPLKGVPLKGMISATLAPPGAPLVSYVKQTETNWCWAACGEMLMQARGIHQTQCTLASTQFTFQCCPSPGAPQGCNKGCWPDECYKDAGVDTKRVEAPLSRATVSAELAAGRVVQVCYRWTGTDSTHVALIVDEYPNGDFEVYDPWPSYGPGRRQFSQIQTAYGLGAWILSFTFKEDPK
jgi:hypothetical protein